MSTIPPLPPGFTLLEDQQAMPPLPPGFTLIESTPPTSLLESAKAAVTDIGPEIASGVRSALSTINRNLNPFNAERQAATLAESKAPFFDLKPRLESIAGVGEGLAAYPLGIPASVPAGVGRSVIGHGLEATGQFTYEEGKDAADKAMMGIRAGSVGANAQPRPLPQVPPPAKEILNAGSAGYKSPEVTALEIEPRSTRALSTQIQSELLTEGFRPSSGSAKGVFKEVKNLAPPQNVQSVKVADLDSARRALQIYAKELNAQGKPTPQANAATKAINHIDDYLDNISPSDVLAGDASAAAATLKTARADWAAGKTAEEVTYKLSKAERQSAKSGSGSNIENAMRQKIDQIPDRGLTAAEKALRDQIVLGDRPRDALRTSGKLGVDGGLSLMLHTAMGLGTGGATLPISAAGTIARKVGEGLTKKQIAELNRMIRARSPYAKSMPPRHMLPPSPLLSPMLPYSLQQSLPLLLGMKPVYADEDE
jgi:hypothetical protein